MVPLFILFNGLGRLYKPLIVKNKIYFVHNHWFTRGKNRSIRSAFHLNALMKIFSTTTEGGLTFAVAFFSAFLATSSFVFGGVNSEKRMAGIEGDP